MTAPSSGSVGDLRDERAGGALPGWLAALLGPDASVVSRQLPFTAVFGLGLLALPLPGVDVVTAGCVIAAAVVVLGALLLARFAPWDRWPEAAQDVLPVLEIVAVGFLRAGTGNTASMYTSLVFMPVVALASQRGRRGVVIVALGVIGVILVPVIFNPDLELTSAIVVRSGYVALIAVVIALSIHEVTERLRRRTEAIAALHANEQRMLERMRADAWELASVAANRKVVRDQLVSVIDSATEQAIIAADSDGLVEVFNAGAERMLGYAQGDVVGHLHVRDFALADEADYDAYVAAVVAGNAPMRDWTVVRADGSHTLARLAVTLRYDVTGEPAGYVIVATDVTEEREAARLKDEFVSLVSHELRTPLTSVLGYLELMQDGTDPLTDEQREYLGIIERNARRQLRLVGDLLLTAQVDAGTFAITPAPTDLADVARTAVAAATPNAEAAGVALELAVEPAPIQGDVGRLGQAVDNLISNALKFTPRGGTVRVRVEAVPTGGARLAVADTGIGIPPDELTRLTTRFFRATTATRRAIPGVGLGLSITKAVVDAHRGTLDITSAVGEGTTFTIDLPASPTA
ncbi:sensor histidine kinase [Cellulomonas alba]|uniref:histidine kinase n=1 Tax=Cellulomonas alba TaxID=3053467 RepID=A0ABT7SEA1_9CELL|nr:ATP-binding protein [Cellulomonas alba]MDM7854496.1 ATP-binding protein [Cellulomonas alba]